MASTHLSAWVSSMAPLPLASQMPYSLTKIGSPAFTAFVMVSRSQSVWVAA